MFLTHSLTRCVGFAALAAASCAPAPLDLDGAALDPLSNAAPASVFVFTRTDCPIANRYAPELVRLHDAYAGEGARFWLVYADASETAESIRAHVEEYDLPLVPIRDPEHVLVERFGATVTPEAAVVGPDGELRYRGRIDDRFPEYGVNRPVSTRDLDAAIASALKGEPGELVTTRAVGCYLVDLK